MHNDLCDVGQLGKLFGANIIGTTSSAEKAEVAKKRGADHVLLYTKGPIIDDVLKITGGVGVQAVYDGVGKDTYVLMIPSSFFCRSDRRTSLTSLVPDYRWEDNFALIARKGTIVSIGNASGAVPPFAPLKLVAKNLKVLRPTYVYVAASVSSFLRASSIPMNGLLLTLDCVSRIQLTTGLLTMSTPPRNSDNTQPSTSSS